MEIQDIKKTFFDYENAGVGRKSQYNNAKELLEKMKIQKILII